MTNEEWLEKWAQEDAEEDKRIASIPEGCQRLVVFLHNIERSMPPAMWIGEKTWFRHDGYGRVVACGHGDEIIWQKAHRQMHCIGWIEPDGTRHLFGPTEARLC